jgi:hypothetical protein
VNPSDALAVALVLVADFCVSFISGFLPASLDGNELMLGNRRRGGSPKLRSHHVAETSDYFEVVAS